MFENTQSDQCSSNLGCTSKDRILLHISDLHFGFDFNDSKWQDLKDKALEIKPDLVVITGDLVNTPWFWMLSRVKSELNNFSDALGKVPIRIKDRFSTFQNNGHFEKPSFPVSGGVGM